MVAFEQAKMHNTDDPFIMEVHSLGLDIYTEIYKDLCRCMQYPEFLKCILHWRCAGLDRIGVMIIGSSRGSNKL